MEETRYIGRANLTKRLTSLEGQVGRTRYRDGSARLEYAGATLTVTPPFGLGHEGEYERAVLGPLLEALGEDHTVAALLVRLGGYAVGAFEGERLVASKVGSRFVKGRHRAGGSSANRFRRRREGQNASSSRRRPPKRRACSRPGKERSSGSPWAATAPPLAACSPPAPTLPGCSRSCSNGSLPCPSHAGASSTSSPTSSTPPR